MDGTPFLAGLRRRFRRGRDDEGWEQEIVAQVERVAASGEQHVQVLIPAVQSELGRRLEVATRLMKDNGYRLHMVTPADDLKWAAGYEKVTD
ncbi:MAG: hypothetical protein ACRDKT_03200 [Actinomycetota bacterium]